MEISGRGSLYYKENAVNNARFCAIRTALNTAFYGLRAVFTAFAIRTAYLTALIWKYTEYMEYIWMLDKLEAQTCRRFLAAMSGVSM